MNARMRSFSYNYRAAPIVGAGPGLGAGLARRFAREGLRVAIASRDLARLTKIADKTGAIAIPGDAPAPEQVKAMFEIVTRKRGEPDLVVYSASGFLHGAMGELDPAAVRQCLATTASGAFLVAQAAAPAMFEEGAGALLFTRATKRQSADGYRGRPANDVTVHERPSPVPVSPFEGPGKLSS